MATSLQDPFYVVKEEIMQSMQTMQTLYRRWRQLYDSGAIIDNQEFDWTTKELLETLGNLEIDLKDLNESIDIAESQRQRFQLDSEEIRSRRAFVAQSRQRIEDIKTAVQSQDVQLKRKKLERDQLMRQPASGQDDRMSRVNRAIEKDNDEMIRSEGDRQQMILQQQDADLAELEASITRIGEIGVTIRDEVELHNRLLGELEEDVDNTQGRLAGAMEQLKKVAKSADNKKLICCVIVLILILVIIVALVFAL